MHCTDYIIIYIIYIMNQRRGLIFVGSSLKELSSFPDNVKRDIGYALHLAQIGEKATNAKPFKGLNGVFEIVDDYKTDTYRALYLVKMGDKVYVLHAFQKKSKTSIKTPQREIELIKNRYKQALVIFEQQK